MKGVRPKGDVGMFSVKGGQGPCFLRRPVMRRWADFIDGKAETGKVVKIGWRKR
jgi:hypothetical protein